mgnify:CR=1 FL=1
MLTHIGTTTIETDRLLLRRFEYSDDDAMLQYWIADEKIQSMYSEPVYTTKEAVKELLDKYISSYEKEDYYRNYFKENRRVYRSNCVLSC